MAFAKYLLCALFIFSKLSYGAITLVRVDASTSNIPTSFSSGATSQVITGVLRVRSVLIDNRSSSEIAINCSTGATVVPADTANTNMYVAGTSQIAIDDALTGGTCYIRSMTGSPISTGTLVIMLVGG